MTIRTGIVCGRYPNLPVETTPFSSLTEFAGQHLHREPGRYFHCSSAVTTAQGDELDLNWIDHQRIPEGCVCGNEDCPGVDGDDGLNDGDDETIEGRMEEI